MRLKFPWATEFRSHHQNGVNPPRRVIPKVSDHRVHACEDARPRNLMCITYVPITSCILKLESLRHTSLLLVSKVLLSYTKTLYFYHAQQVSWSRCFACVHKVCLISRGKATWELYSGLTKKEPPQLSELLGSQFFDSKTILRGAF